MSGNKFRKLLEDELRATCDGVAQRDGCPQPTMEPSMRGVILGLVLMFGVACSPDQEPSQEGTEMVKPANQAEGASDVAAARLREFAERYTAAWCSQEPASVAAFFSPTGSLRVNDGTPAVGRAAITEVAQGFMTTFPDMEVLMDDLLIRDDGAVFEWTLVGTNTGPGGTGNRVRISGFEVWRIGADGLIAESEGHFDSNEYQRQLEDGVTE